MKSAAVANDATPGEELKLPGTEIVDRILEQYSDVPGVPISVVHKRVHSKAYHTVYKKINADATKELARDFASNVVAQGTEMKPAGPLRCFVCFKLACLFNSHALISASLRIQTPNN